MEMTLVKNQISLWMVVNLNFVSPDMRTRRPMTVRSPVANTTPRQLPCVTNVELSAKLRVSRAFSEVASRDPGIISLVYGSMMSSFREDQLYRPFTGKKRAIKTQIRGHFNDPEIGRYTITSREHDNVPNNNVICRDEVLIAVAYDRSLLSNERLDGLHDAVCVKVYQGVERSGDDDDEYLCGA